MSDNPLDDNPAREALIRERAYHLWEADGRPQGRQDEYWERASELVRMERSGNPGQLPNPATQPGADPYRREPVEEAFLQDNLGEFADRFVDQGEVHQTPMSRQEARQEARSDAPSSGAAGPARDLKPPKGEKPAKPASQPKAAKPDKAPKPEENRPKPPKPKEAKDNKPKPPKKK